MHQSGGQAPPIGRQHIDENLGDLHGHFDTATEAVSNEIRRLDAALTHFDENLDKSFAGIRDEMRRGFSETQALILRLTLAHRDAEASDIADRPETP